jgi:hypothetical protein
MALVGIVLGNPERTLRVDVMYGMLLITGLGSAALHATLHWIFQSCDEIPMMWTCWGILYCAMLAQKRTTKNCGVWCYENSLDKIVLAINVGQAVIYYRFQSLYAVFLISFISLAAAVIYSLYLLASEEKMDTETSKQRWTLAHLAVFTFVVVAGGIWVFDMHFCDFLLPYYNATPVIGPITLHVLWHLAAGYACFVTMTLVVLAGLQNTGRKVSVNWVFCLPVCQFDSTDSSSDSGHYNLRPRTKKLA